MKWRNFHNLQTLPQKKRFGGLRNCGLVLVPSFGMIHSHDINRINIHMKGLAMAFKKSCQRNRQFLNCFGLRSSRWSSAASSLPRKRITEALIRSQIISNSAWRPLKAFKGPKATAEAERDGRGRISLLRKKEERDWNPDWEREGSGSILPIATLLRRTEGTQIHSDFTIQSYCPMVGDILRDIGSLSSLVSSGFDFVLQNGGLLMWLRELVTSYRRHRLWSGKPK